MFDPGNKSAAQEPVPAYQEVSKAEQKQEKVRNLLNIIKKCVAEVFRIPPKPTRSYSTNFQRQLAHNNRDQEVLFSKQARDLATCLIIADIVSPTWRSIIRDDIDYHQGAYCCSEFISRKINCIDEVSAITGLDRSCVIMAFVKFADTQKGHDMDRFAPRLGEAQALCLARLSLR